MVVDDHEGGNQHHTDDTHPDTVLDVGFAQLGIGVKDGVDFDLEGEAAGNESVSNAFGFVLGEGAGNFGVAAGDGTLNPGSAVELAVKDDGEGAADVVGGDTAELFSALEVEAQSNLTLTELVAGGHGHGDVFAVHGNMTVNEEVLDEGSFTGAELLSLHEFVASGNTEVLGGFLIFLNQSLVVGMDKAEVQLGAHLDEFKEFQLFIFSHNGGAQSHVVAAGRSDFGFVDLLALKAFAQNFDGHVTVTVELVAHTGFHLFTGFAALGVGFEPFQEVFIGNQLKDELNTAVEVKTQTD